MHYRNGREAKNGDVVVTIGEKWIDGKGITGRIVALGVLHEATPGNDFCNGSIAPINPSVTGAMHVPLPAHRRRRRAASGEGPRQATGWQVTAGS